MTKALIATAILFGFAFVTMVTSFAQPKQGDAKTTTVKSPKSNTRILFQNKTTGDTGLKTRNSSGSKSK